MPKQDDSHNLTDKDEFNRQVAAWADMVRSKSVEHLAIHTHGEGDLQKSFRTDLGNTARYAVNRIAFGFKRHGVFLHYGVGRGYVRQNGRVVRGQKVVQRNYTHLIAKDKWKAGYRMSEIRKMKITFSESGIRRKPLDWFDREIEQNIDRLADMAGEYYGDRALGAIRENKRNIQIDKSRSHGQR